MYRRNRTAILLFLILTVFNILVFLFRNKGFEYVRHSDKTDLYSASSDSTFFRKWNSANKFSQKDLDSGYSILVREIRVDTIVSDLGKIKKVSAWLFRRFSAQIGRPADTLNRLTPLEQCIYLTNHKNQELWCGQFQRMFGFFMTSCGLVNRYVEVVPRNNVPPDVHEVNEVWVPSLNDWIMVDVSRNRLITMYKNEFLSAAEYLDIHQLNITLPLSIIGSDSVLIDSTGSDHYFNRNYFLRYYQTMDLNVAYAFKAKLKRYFLENPWYEVYDPLSKHSNYLFRIKQGLLFSWIALGVLLVFVVLLKTKRKR